MKPISLLIAVSLAANGLLLGVLFRAAPAPDPAPSSDLASTTRSRAARTSVAPDAKVDPALWKALSASDRTDQLARLRAAGFPPDIVRAIMLAQIQDSFAARRKALNPATNPTNEFWKNAQPTDPKIATELRALNREQNRLVSDLLGPDPQANPLQAIADGQTGLSPGKAGQIARIKQDYNEMRSEIYSAFPNGGVSNPESRAQLSLLEKEQRADIERSLSPDELALYDLNTSQTASSMRSQLIGFNPTEAEFRAIYAKRLAFDQQYNPSSIDAQFLLESGTARSQETMRQRQEAQKQLTAQIVATLGPERGAEYERSLDGNYQQINRVVDRLGLPAAAAVEAWNLQKDIQQRAQALQTNRQLPVEDRNAQLAALNAEATAKLTTTLGARGFDVYKTNGGQWLQNLQPRPAAPAGARGGAVGGGTTVIRSIGN